GNILALTLSHQRPQPAATGHFQSTEDGRFIPAAASSGLNYLSQLRSCLIGWAPRKTQLKIRGEAAKVVRYLDVVSILLRSTLTIQQATRKEERTSNKHSRAGT